jgi:hypothetical protein
MDPEPAKAARHSFQPADATTQHEVGGILERAFHQEGGRAPDEAEREQLLAVIEATEERAKSAERQAVEAGEAAAHCLAEPNREALEQAHRWSLAGYQHQRQAYDLYLEAFRLQQFLGAGEPGPASEKLTRLLYLAEKTAEQTAEMARQMQGLELEAPEGRRSAATEASEALAVWESEATELRQNIEQLRNEVMLALEHHLIDF